MKFEYIKTNIMTNITMIDSKNCQDIITKQRYHTHRYIKFTEYRIVIQGRLKCCFSCLFNE